MAAPGLPNHLFVVDQPGQSWALDLNAPRPVACSMDDPGNPACTLFFDIGTTGLDRLAPLGCVPESTRTFGGSFDERGLLGLAFHRNFASNERFYTYTSEPNAGAGGGVVREIFAFGMRNPYGFSIDEDDPEHLYVGNVGQNDIEEVELVRSGANHGWPIKEGTLFFDHNGNADGFATPDNPGTVAVIPPDLVDPVSQYDTFHEGHAVVGGFIYRGDEVKDLRGKFVFGDFSLVFRFPVGPQDQGRLFSQNRRSNPGGGLRTINELRIVPGNRLALALRGWGEDSAGEIYPLGNISGLPFFNEGLVLKIVPATEAQDVD